MSPVNELACEELAQDLFNAGDDREAMRVEDKERMILNAIGEIDERVFHGVLAKNWSLDEGEGLPTNRVAVRVVSELPSDLDGLAMHFKCNLDKRKRGQPHLILVSEDHFDSATPEELVEVLLLQVCRLIVAVTMRINPMVNRHTAQVVAQLAGFNFEDDTPYSPGVFALVSNFH